ncbi:hypothetical protein [Shewanella sp. GutCb]|nr:hypothetical protein [Shewanella sp. GutCb]
MEARHNIHDIHDIHVMDGHDRICTGLEKLKTPAIVLSIKNIEVSTPCNE